MFRYLLVIVITCIAGFTKAQVYHIEGVVIDTSGQPIRAAQVNMLSKLDTLSSNTNERGVFNFIRVDTSSYYLIVSVPGVTITTPVYHIRGGYHGKYSLSPIVLNLSSVTLSEIVVKGEAITIKEDTIEYRASGYKVRDGALAEELLKKMPGIDIDHKGSITAQGQKITRVRVNGKDFFGSDITVATKNLPADIIDNIQVIDDYGEQARLTEIKTGEPEKVININTKKSKRLGSFGNASLAGGTLGRYLASISANNFTGERQISLIGSMNNVSAGDFISGNDIVNNNETGINSTHSVGLNYRDKLGKSGMFYGNYSYSSRDNNNNSVVFQQDFNPFDTRLSDRVSESHTKNVNHRLQLNIEYTLTAADYLKISPFMSTSSSNSYHSSIASINRAGFATNSAVKTSSTDSKINAGAYFIYNHKFKKKGRNFTVDVSFDYANQSQSRRVNGRYDNIDSVVLDTAEQAPLLSSTLQRQNIEDRTRLVNTSFKISYIEPLSKKVFAEATYSHNRNADQNYREVYDFDSLSIEPNLNLDQTTHYSSAFITDRYGLNLKQANRRFNYVVGVVTQIYDQQGQSEEQHTSTNYHAINWMPNARFVYKFQTSSTLTIAYSGGSHEPGLAQLQPSVDSSNLTNIIVGNPNLRAEFFNRININYSKYEKNSGSTLFANLSLNETQNKIVKKTYNETGGTGRTTTYGNENGVYSLTGNVNVTRPFLQKRYSLSMSMSAHYNTTTNYIDNEKSNGINWAISPTVRLHVDLANRVDLYAYCRYSLNAVISKYETYSQASRTRTLSFGINGKTYFLKDWTIGYEYSKMLNYGYDSNVSANPDILNLYLEYRFLRQKLAKIRLQGFDLFNQNTGISRTIDGTTITDSRTLRLGRYLLLSLNFRLRAKSIGQHKTKE